MRRCSKTACPGEARATLTYNYADSTVVIGPLSRRAEPHTYDLCADHADRITAPRGWEVVRLELPDHYVPVDGSTDASAPAAPTPPPAPPRLAPPSAPSAEDPAAAQHPAADPAARPALRVIRASDV